MLTSCSDGGETAVRSDVPANPTGEPEQEVPVPCQSVTDVDSCIEDYTGEAEARPIELPEELEEEFERIERQTDQCLESIDREAKPTTGSGIFLTCGTLAEEDRIFAERDTIDAARSRSLADGVEASVRAWLKGPSKDEIEKGLRTPLTDSEAILTTVAVEGGTATISFHEAGLLSATRSWELPAWDERFIRELSWTLEIHPELEFIVVMAGDRCYQDFVAQAPCEPIELRSSAPQSETTAEAGDGPSEFCVAAASFDEERPEAYVGSTEHVNDITMLAALAPEAIQGPALTYRDFLKGGGVDPADPESNVVLNWPAEVQAAVADLAGFVAANC